MRKHLLLFTSLVFIVITGCKKQADEIKHGTFTAMTYNIAGLPEPISGSHPAINTPLIAKLLNDYDVVNVQEDFNYDQLLRANDRHPFKSKYEAKVSFGDGLNLLSNFPFTDFVRTQWTKCEGTDCLTPKGFTYSRLNIAGDVFIDLYDVHCDAGSTPEGYAARKSNILQLVAYIDAHSQGHAVIIMGDTNTEYTETQENPREILNRGFKDVWVELIRHGILPTQNDSSLDCGNLVTNEVDCEELDKIFYRSNDEVKLTALEYAIPGDKFLDVRREWLSDHRPVFTKFQFDILK
ncbi:MAG: Endonuclease/Exonuclease/phosphatase family protein [Bacteroidota bacterium]|nr:Endonuclease/Exonuclease/phosphatase family protein [Bacteroidota bacterium]